MPPNRSLAALEAITRAHPQARKWLVGPDINWSRESLLALARRTGGWLGWESVTLRTVAEELAFVVLSERATRDAGDIELTMLVNAALDDVVGRHAVSEPFAALERGLGFRRAVFDAVGTLRVAGISPAMLRARAPRAADIAAVLEAYERRLADENLADPAAVFHAALACVETEAPHVVAPVIAIAPGVREVGLPGRLLRRLVALGAQPLPEEELHGLERPATPLTTPWPGDAEPSLLGWLNDAADAPESLDRTGMDLLHAATPTDEIREVLRRILQEGVRLEDVEIVTTDRDAHAIALECVAGPLGIAHTSLHGVPFLRTRLGRVLDRWLRWLQDGLPADALREAVEAGEFAFDDVDADPMACARLLRELGVGWGRARWEQALELLASAEFRTGLRQREEEGDDEFALRRARRERDSAALAGLLGKLLALLPPVPERGSHETVMLPVAAIANATTQYLALVPTLGASEALTRERLDTRLEGLVELSKDEVPFGVAVATLRDVLVELRAWVTHPAGGKPWNAAPGALHLVDVAHAGTTGRPRIFVVGLDADRTSGARHGDPILDDGIRHALGDEALPTSFERARRQRWQLAQALASLRGRITLSYASSADLSGREVGPSPVLLQAFRLIHQDPTADYRRFRKHESLLSPACALPTDGRALDARDVWLAALARGPLLLDGEHLVRQAHPALATGLGLREALGRGTIEPFLGLVPDAAILDPRRAGRGISPSSLEQLARCPLAWFYQRGLRLQLPDDPLYDPNQWLDHLDRGSLLHEIFERFVRAWRGRQDEIAGAEAPAALAAIVDECLAAWTRKVPPPSAAVFASEAADIHRTARSFLQMEIDALAARGHGTWRDVELAFGFDEKPASFTLPDGDRLAIHGRIDRVDEVQGGFVIVDYKTGNPKKHAKDPKQGPFNGGRSLQPAIYAAAVASVLGKPVQAFEYRFPTLKGRNATVRYEQAEMAPAPALVAQLLEHVATGHFLPTLDPSDCSSCDCRPICRVQVDDYFKVLESPRADWAAGRAGSLEAYRGMRERRSAGADA
jgi:RecB family exonuclease